MTNFELPWPFTGREDELELIRRALTAGHPGIVITGPAGRGKTRLATEAVRGTDCARVTGTPEARDIPFAAFAHLLPEPVSLHRAVRCLSATGSGTKVLLVDDAHLLDDASAALVHQLAVHGRVRLLVTASAPGPVAPPAVSRLWTGDLLPRLPLSPLSREDTTRLLTAATATTPEPLTATRLHRLCQGDLRLLRDLVAAVREGGRTAGTGVGALPTGLRGGGRGSWTADVRGSAAPAPAPPAAAAAAGARAWAELGLPPGGSGRRTGSGPGSGGLPAAVRGAAVLIGAGEKAASSADTGRGGTGSPAGLGAGAAGPPTGSGCVRDRSTASVQRAGASADAGHRGTGSSGAAGCGLGSLSGGPRGAGAPAPGARVAGGPVGAWSGAAASADVVREGGPSDGGSLRSGASNPVGHEAEMSAVVACGPAPSAEPVRDGARGRVPTGGAGEWAWRGPLPVTAAVRERTAVVLAHPHPAARDVLDRLAFAEPLPLPLDDVLDAAPLAVLEQLEADALIHVDDHAAVRLAHPLHGPALRAAAGRLRARRLARSPEQCAAALDAEAAVLLRHIEEADVRDLPTPVGEWLAEEGAPVPAGYAALRARFGRLRGELREAVAWAREGLRTAPADTACRLELALSAAQSGDIATAHAAHPEGRAPARAETWLAAARADMTEALAAIDDTDPLSRYDAVRIGAAEHLTGLPLACDLFARHAEALAHADGPALDRAAHALEERGFLLFAAEAHAQAVHAHRDPRAARMSRTRAVALARRCQGARTPALSGLVLGELTARQRQIVTLAAAGLSNRQIAEHLTLSVRTVGNHLYGAYTRLGSPDRAALPWLADGPGTEGEGAEGERTAQAESA